VPEHPWLRSPCTHERRLEGQSRNVARSRSGYLVGSPGSRVEAKTCDDGSTRPKPGDADLAHSAGSAWADFPPGCALAARHALPEFRLGRAADALRRLRRAARGCRCVRDAGEHAAGVADAGLRQLSSTRRATSRSPARNAAMERICSKGDHLADAGRA
jgi:hypothetical protein